ncbi:MAG: 4Fe-4S binding protein, partial [Planctomycetia bacterium]
IENWCIGCGACAESCPYGSIQMHDIGVVPTETRDVRYLRGSLAANNRWHEAGARDSDWSVGVGPFEYDVEFREELTAQARRRKQPSELRPDEPVLFRVKFDLPPRARTADVRLQLELSTNGEQPRVYLNGYELGTAPLDAVNQKKVAGIIAKKEARTIPYIVPCDHQPPGAGGDGTDKSRPWGTAEAGAPRDLPAAKAAFGVPPGRLLKARGNVLAVRVIPTPGGKGSLCEVRVDELRTPPPPPPSALAEATIGTFNPEDAAAAIRDEVEEKLVTQRAVVCDLCSSLPGQVPSCVNACPHEAAMRVNARFEFPVG